MRSLAIIWAIFICGCVESRPTDLDGDLGATAAPEQVTGPPTRTHIAPAALAAPSGLLDQTRSRILIGTYTGRVVFPLQIDYPSNSTTTRISRWALRMNMSAGIGTV